jgi:3D (Asp-Asp-Asp) domain-containing protein
VLLVLLTLPLARADDKAAGAGGLQPAAATTSVRVRVDGKTVTGRVRATEVASALDELGIKLSALDRVAPLAGAALPKGAAIVVTRVQRREVAESRPVPFGREYQYSEELRAGLRKTLKQGREGRKARVYEVWCRDGKETLRKLLREDPVEAPQNEVVLIGALQTSASRGMPRPRKAMEMEATGYSPGPQSCGKYADGRTACGLRAQYGVVAVDPRIIPFGTRLFVEGYGYAIAADTGSAIKGKKIDLCHATHKTALAVGRHKVTVYLLD